MALRIVITGASGFVGAGLVPRLRAAGIELLLVGRDPARLEGLRGPGTRICRYEELGEEGRGADALVHLAVRNNDQGGDEAAFRAANVTLLEEVLEGARAAGIGTIINAATIKAGGAYGQSKAEAEQLLARQEGLRVVTLRLAAVYDDGAYRGTLALLDRVPRPLRPALRNAMMCIKPATHIDRVAGAVIDALREPGSASFTRIVTDRQDGNVLYHGIARLIDLAFVLAIVGLLWWLLLLVWIGVRVSSPGPGIFAQTRVGRHGEPFTCYKFRTMKKDTRQSGTHEVGRDSVTGIGAVLRKTKIDEFPQVINLLRNEMSLVGPRPCLPSQEELVAERRRLGVLDAKGGITGWAQIKGVDMSDPVRLAALDAEYLALRTVPLDLKILLATFTGSGQGDRVSSR